MEKGMEEAERTERRDERPGEMGDARPGETGDEGLRSEVADCSRFAVQPEKMVGRFPYDFRRRGLVGGDSSEVRDLEAILPEAVTEEDDAGVGGGRYVTPMAA